MSEYRWAKWLEYMENKNMVWDEESKSFKRIEDKKDEQ